MFKIKFTREIAVCKNMEKSNIFVIAMIIHRKYNTPIKLFFMVR